MVSIELKCLFRMFIQYLFVISAVKSLKLAKLLPLGKVASQPIYCSFNFLIDRNEAVESMARYKCCL